MPDRNRLKVAQKKIICFCNNIDEKTIQEAICNGAQTLNQIYDATTAGVGPCGGSCRRKIAPMLEDFLKKEEPLIKQD